MPNTLAHINKIKKELDVLSDEIDTIEYYNEQFEFRLAMKYKKIIYILCIIIIVLVAWIFNPTNPFKLTGMI